MSIKICLDAGHYGKYNRSPVVPEYYESDMTWKLHLLLKAELEKYGIEVITTRPNQETDKGLVERGQTSAGCDLFISLHSNGVTGKEWVDYPVVYYPISGTCKDLADTLAKFVEQTMGTKENGRAASRKSDNGNWDYYSVIYGAVSVGTPGLIIEHSFHTNTKATKWLLDDSNLQKLAVGETEIIAKHFGLSKEETKVEEKQIYRIRKSWEDAKSQIGAYEILENAINACPDGYTVYDKDGKVIYPEQKKTDVVTVSLPELQLGSKGASVKALQILLIGYGYDCGTWGADGDFGSNTDSAVRYYQAFKGISVDGIVGNDTWSHLLGIK